MVTMIKKFKPMLAPNDQPDLKELTYPLLASYKLDGIRCLIRKGELLSRSLKQIQNKQLREKLEWLQNYSDKTGCTFDGEIYSPELTFQEITSFVMTKDLAESKTVKKNGGVKEIPEHLNYYCFDNVNGEDNIDQPFHDRLLFNVNMVAHETYVPVEQRLVNSAEEVEAMFEEALAAGCEGLILKSTNGRYKCGRGTLNEGLIFKVKPFRTFDAKIVGVVQATRVDENAEKTTNELGRSVTSKKKGDRILIEKAAAYEVMYEGKVVKAVLAMTDEEKEFVWANRDSFIGKWIEYKGMLVGAKDVPRHPVMIRYRSDKD